MEERINNFTFVKMSLSEEKQFLENCKHNNICKVKEIDLEKEFFDWYHKENETDYQAGILYEKYGTISKKLAKYFFKLGINYATHSKTHQP